MQHLRSVAQGAHASLLRAWSLAESSAVGFTLGLRGGSWGLVTTHSCAGGSTYAVLDQPSV